ncbi:mitogen-activated protein kinase HOG1, partial [Colletotrichum sojae]
MRFMKGWGRPRSVDRQEAGSTGLHASRSAPPTVAALIREHPRLCKAHSTLPSIHLLAEAARLATDSTSFKPRNVDNTHPSSLIMSKKSGIKNWIRIGKNQTVLWELNRDDFLGLLKLYPKFLTTGIQELDKKRFRGMTALGLHQFQNEDEDEDEDENENEQHNIIINLSHWFYKRCHGEQRDGCKHHHQCLKASHSTAIEAAVGEAFNLFDSNERASAVSKLQKLLKRSRGPDHTKFEFAILILSAKYPNHVPFCSPELRNCVKGLSINASVNKNDWGTQSYAEEYARFKFRCDLVVKKIRATAQNIEKVAYVLDGWRVLKDTYIDHSVIEIDEDDEWAAFGAANTTIRKGSTPLGHHSLPKIFAVKSISEFKGVVVNYLSEIRVHATGNKDELREHLVAYYGWSFWDGHFHIAMQLMSNDLEDLLTRRRNPVSWGEAVKKWSNPTKKSIQSPLRQLLAGLRALHDRGITHRDLKPRVTDTLDWIARKNILLDDDFNVKIADFGISKQARNRKQTTMATNAGTTGYTAPEVLGVDQEFHGSYTNKADLWSLGCVIYRMVKGRQLFAHDDETKREAGEKV